MEEERFGVQLGLLVESSGRVQTAVGRVMRWGLGAVDVATNQSNRDALLRDLDDMKVNVGRIERALASAVGELPVAPVEVAEVECPFDDCCQSEPCERFEEVQQALRAGDAV
jgi:hypothetical protein